MLTHSSHCMCPTIEAQISNVLRVWLMIWFDIRLERANKHGKRVAEHENGKQKIVALFFSFFFPDYSPFTFRVAIWRKICKSVYCREKKTKKKGVRHIFSVHKHWNCWSSKMWSLFFLFQQKLINLGRLCLAFRRPTKSFGYLWCQHCKFQTLWGIVIYFSGKYSTFSFLPNLLFLWGYIIFFRQIIVVVSCIKL